MQRYVYLDGLRGVAALSVAIMHSSAIVGTGQPWFGNVALAVDFFFCLSGFVVAHAYDAKLQGQMSVAGFMQRRLVRLYPMILFGVLLGGAVGVYLGQDRVGPRTLMALALVPEIDAGEAYKVDGPMWSLFFELAACFGYGLLIKLLPRRFDVWLLAASGVVLAAAILYTGNLTNLGHSGLLGFLGGFPRVAFPFLLGVLLHRSGIVSRLPPLHPAIGVAALLALLFAPSLEPHAYQLFAAMLALPAVMVLGAATKTSARTLPAWEWSGRLSYPLYLLHWPVMMLVAALLPDLAPAQRMAAMTASALGVSWLVLRLYDEPVRAMLTAALSGKRLRAAAAS